MDGLACGDTPHDHLALADPRVAHDDDLGDAAHRARLKAQMFGRPLDAPKIGRYAILKVLGEGGMGTVYSAYDDRLDRRVAVKRIKGELTEGLRVRMLREAQALAKLSHPHVVPVYEVGTHQGQLYFAMEYVRGSTLHRWQEQQERPWLEVLQHYLQAGRGLAAAHAAGLVHRDFKPHNAIVGEDGRVRVLDFGLAARGGEALDFSEESTVRAGSSRRALDTPLTETGTVMGTPAYMAPEQVLGGEVDPRSDQFSLCVALWEALYGRRPFDGDDLMQLQANVARGELAATGRSEVPEEIRSLLARGLHHSPDERWPDLSTLLDELQRFVPTERDRKGRYSGGDAAVAAVVTAAVWTPCIGLAAFLDPIPDAPTSTGARLDLLGLYFANLLATGVPWSALTGFVVRRRLHRAEDRRRWGWWRLVGLSWPSLLALAYCSIPFLVGNYLSGAPLPGVVSTVAGLGLFFFLLIVLERTLPRARGESVTMLAAASIGMVVLLPVALLLVLLGHLDLMAFVQVLPLLGMIATGGAVTIVRAESRGSAP
ncbi:MAG: serine/threonine-protein kinase [Nannocystaceae bacterium]